MELIGTTKSHFTRKIRLLLDHLEVPYAFIDIGDVSVSNSHVFGNNPILSVPVLNTEQGIIYDSDHIASYIVRQFDPNDQYDVTTTDFNRLNARAILNGAMAAEVRLVLAQRTGLVTDNVVYFEKAKTVIKNSLDWCEVNVALFKGRKTDYLTFHFISFWEHVNHYGLIDGDWPKLSTLAGVLSQYELVKLSEISSESV